MIMLIDIMYSWEYLKQNDFENIVDGLVDRD
jgi:hypothetical protein